MEEFKSDIEEALTNCTRKKFSIAWNKIFPEENVDAISLKNEELREEFLQLIVEELDFIEPDLFAKVYNTLCEEKIKAEDLYI